MDLRTALSQERVQDPDLPDSVEIGPGWTVAEGISLMQKRGTGCLAVTENRLSIGVFTVGDIARKALAGSLAHTAPLPT